ncbi:vacuolar ATP synthase subunit f, putative [Plasmodium reichenowi]|uniref:V-type proton ATPase subunit F n=7 Tax=Plasmodium (Laverania) TaxID=418107 RepID=Q8IHW4_PLAF7|nr:V-type proton ATPase subunit F, putative [Plasmodium falciparum 3D7]XP_012763798.1 vacuolar ATP synthase subunit f, putative [Plasmodium reichenowi]ETW35471.1 V-type ATPase, F subunit [Plasmodium falciparum Tanzania (2000708)]ETW42184.1 V-type ATPase, F subunit [Plasmodium falciparum NF135/5.C10]ETW48493.1 V-type ATPase, F subunit [Plasmodium falciparum MaliPS096_E11]KAF4330937.1 V-type proton ATPase subunit F [Plasmodium falciparum NF54]KNG75180.1 vacuolar ATP synthase [Plasmodium falcipa|eukprot:XP_001348082.2 V-type proton ATPase subunit F, putative [Plasmodium falciparum 3D7]
MASRRHRLFNETDLKIYIIGDEDSVVGFLLAGIGFRDGLGKKNFFIVNSKTNKSEIEEVFKEYSSKHDCGVILINQQIADEIRYLVDLHDKILPTVLEIPSKDKPFDPNKDSIIQRVKLFFGGDISHL